MGEAVSSRSKFVSIIKIAAVLIALSFYPLEGPGAAQNRKIDFNREIRPILADKCFTCHGPDATNLGIKLRLDSESAALADLGKGRHAIVPGRPEESQLVKRITAKDDAMRMPPADSGRSLSRQEIEQMLREGGATPEARIQWAFRLLTSREPDSGERQVLIKNFRMQLDHFRAQSKDAAQLLKVGEKRSDAKWDAAELAAYAATASLILNLDEVITKQ